MNFLFVLVWLSYWCIQIVLAFQKLPLSAEEYIRNAPYISEDGGVTLGSKKTAVFLVDSKSGKVVHTYNLDDSPSTSGVRDTEENPVLSDEDAEELVESSALDLESIEQPLYIKRTDYVLQHYSPDNGKVLWNVTFAEFDAAFGYQKIDSSYGGSSPKGGNKLIPAVNSQLLYQSAPIVLRNRGQRLIDSLDGLLKGHSGGRPLPASSHSSLPGAINQSPEAPRSRKGGQMLSLPASGNDNSGSLVMLDVDANEMNIPLILKQIMVKLQISYIISFLLALLSILGSIFYCRVAFGKQRKLNTYEEELKVYAGAPKKKRSRRLGNNKKNAIHQEMPRDISYDNKVGDTNRVPLFERNQGKSLVTFTDLVDGRRIGKLRVSNKEIAKGSNGTIVLEGNYDGRPVAVKRLVKTHHDVALKEIQNLIASDHHPNIVRWYGVECDQDFVYLSLERCTCSLNDLIFICSESFQCQLVPKDPDTNSLNEYNVQFQSIKENNKDVELWKKNGYPSPQLLKLMRLVNASQRHLFSSIKPFHGIALFAIIRKKKIHPVMFELYGKNSSTLHIKTFAHVSGIFGVYGGSPSGRF